MDPLPAPLLLIPDCDAELLSVPSHAVAAAMRSPQQPLSACAQVPRGLVLCCPPCPQIDADEPFNTLPYTAQCKQLFQAQIAWEMEHDRAVDFFYLQDAPHFAALRAAVLSIYSVGKPVIVQLHAGADARMHDHTDCLAALCVLQRIGVTTVIFTADCAQDLHEALLHVAPEAQVELGIRCPIAWMAQVHLPARLCMPMPNETAARVYQALPQGNFSAVRRVHHESDLLLLSDGRDAHYVDITADISEEIPCDHRLSERLLELEDEGDSIFKLVIEEPEDISALEEYQYMITRPICLCAENPELLEHALHVFQGVALHDGTWEQDDTVLHDFSQRYGLITL